LSNVAKKSPALAKNLTLAFSYIDDEGSKCMVRNDEELAVAISVQENDKQQCVKFTVEVESPEPFVHSTVKDTKMASEKGTKVKVESRPSVHSTDEDTKLPPVKDTNQKQKAKRNSPFSPNPQVYKQLAQAYAM